MNKVFKVIWSKAKSAWIVVSELAKNHDAKGGIHDGRKRYAWLTRAVMLALVLGSTAIVPAYAAAGDKVQYGGVTIGDYPHTQGDLFVYGTSKFYGTVLFNDGEFSYDSQKHGFSFGKAQYNSKLYNYSIAIGDTGEGSDYSIIFGRNSSGKGTYDVVIGDTAYAEKANAVAIGKGASSQGISSIALGESAHATADDSMAIGHSSESTLAGALALGKEAKSHGTDAVAIGTGAQANNNPYGIAIGKNAIVNNQGSIAIGQDSSSDHPYGIAIGGNNVGQKGANANGTYSIALGANSLVNGAEGGAAIGYSAKVDGSDAKDGVALGAYSVSNWATKAGIQGYLPWEGSNGSNVQNSTFLSAVSSPIWKSTTAGVSIGDTSNGDKSKWITRQLTGLAAGTNDYDAVNVAQLKASMTTLSSTDGSVKITPKYNDDGSRTFDLSASGGSGSGSGGHFVGVTKNNAGDSDDSLKNAGNYNNDGATGTQSTAVGVNAQAQTQGTALGNGAQASNTGATAIGTGSVANGTSSVALGQNASAQNDNAVAIGHGSGAYANSVAIGGNARSTAERSVHIGAMTDTNTATGSASVSIGADAKATDSGAASFGTGAEASGTDSLALGQNSSSTGNGSVAIGYQTKVTNNKEHATAVGTSAEANATEGTVLGYNANVNGDKGLALGSGASVAAENSNKTSVALGAGSQVNNGDTVGTASMSIKDTYGETSDSTTYQFAGANPEGTVSVGHTQDGVDHTRTITHVAAGRVSSTSTDAINGSQLYGVARSIEKVEQNVAKTATRYYSVKATDTGTGSNYLNDGAHGLNSLAAGNKAQAYGGGSLAIGNNSSAGNALENKKGYSSLAIGSYANAQAWGSIALGGKASSSGSSDVALGSNASSSSLGGVALGSSANVTVTGGVALGMGSQASTAAGREGYLSGSKKADQAEYVWKSTIGAVSLGGDFKPGTETLHYTRQITNLAAGTNDTDAVNVAQLKALGQEGLSLTGNDGSKVTQSLGGNFNITGGLTGDALKDEAASTANLGVRKNAKGDGLEVVMTTTPFFDTVTAKNSITVRNASTADGTSDISITGTGLSMGGKKITSLVAGTEYNDAATYGQIENVQKGLDDFKTKTYGLQGDDGNSVTKTLGGNPISVGGTGKKTDSAYGTSNIKTLVTPEGKILIGLDKDLVENSLSIGDKLSQANKDGILYPVTLTADIQDAAVGLLNLNGRNGTALSLTSGAGAPSLDNSSQTMTRIQYTDEKNLTHMVATLGDGMAFGGDNTTVTVDEAGQKLTGNNLIQRKLKATEGDGTTRNYLQIKGGADSRQLSSNNIGVVSDGNNGTLTVQLAKNLTGLNQAKFGDTVIDTTGLAIGSGTGKVSLTSSGLVNGGNKITGVAAGTEDTDAVNYSQLKPLINEADGTAKGLSFEAQQAITGKSSKVSLTLGETLKLTASGGDSTYTNLMTKVTGDNTIAIQMSPDVQFNSVHVGDKLSAPADQAGFISYPVTLSVLPSANGENIGYVGIHGFDNTTLGFSSISGDASLVNDKNHSDGTHMTRIYYRDELSKTHQLATLDDGLKISTDSGADQTVTKKLNEILAVTGGASGTLTEGNIGVVTDGSAVQVKLASALTDMQSVTMQGGKTVLDKTSLTTEAVKIGNKTYLSADGLNANGQNVTDVLAGNLKVDSTDAVNGSQLFATNQNVSTNTTNISNLITRLDGAGMTFAGDSGSTTVTLNGTLHVNGADSNLTVTGDTAGLKVGLSKTLTGLTSVEVSGSDFNTTLTGDGLTIAPTSGDSPTPIVFTAGDGINLGNRKIAGVKKGNVQSDSQEAVNGGQLFAVKTTADQASADAKKHSSVTVAGSTDGSNVTGGNLLLTKETNTAGGNQYDLRLNDVLTLGTGNTPITLDGTHGTVTFTNGANTTLQLDGSAGTITGLTNTSYTSLDSLIADKAASEGELKQVAQRVLDMADKGVVNAGNSGSATLKMGQTNTVAGSAVASGKTVDNDYSDANITTIASGDNQGNTTTHIYMKKDLVGNSMNVGTIGADGNIAAPVASLGQAASTATANGESIGQLYLSGEKRLGTGESGNTSATLHVKDVIGSNLTNATEATTRLFYTNESGAENTLAVVEKDGLRFAGDRGDYAEVTLNNILNIKGGAASTASLTSGNIAVTSDGNNTLNIQLAKDLTGLSSAVFVGNDFTSTIQGDGLTITPNNTTGTAQAISLTKNTISMGNRTIQNVADGDITKSDSKEAVNGGQLYRVKQTAEAAQTEAAKHTVITANDSEPANSTTGNVVLTSSDDQGKTTYNIKLNNKITLGSGDNQVVLDGSDTGTSSFGKQITLNGATGAVGVTSLTANGAVSASSVTVGDIILHSAADSTANPDTITGLGNTTYDEKNLVSNRAATEGQLQSLVSQINAGKISAGSTNVVGSSNISISSSKDDTGKITTYTASLTPALTGLTSAVFTNGKTGQDEETNTLTSDGLSLGTDIGATRFTRNGISAGAQQIKNLGSGITGTDGQVTTYTGQADYNNAASIGDVQTILHAAQDVFAGNNSSKATLTLGKTATFKGADVVDANGALLKDTALSSKLQADYSNANITTAASADSDGGVTTNFYLKKDLVGRSLSLGMIDSTTGDVLQPGVKLSSQALSDTDSTQIGHLFLAGEKQTGDKQTGYTSADFYVKDDKGSYLTDANLTDANKPVTRVFFNDETGTSYELATLSDGFHVVGDNSNSVQASLKLNKTLKVNGGISDSDRLTTDNIGVLASQTTAGEDSTLTIQLAKQLTGLSSAAFTGDSTNVIVNGKGIMVTPSTGTDTEKAAGTFALSQDNVSMGSQQVHYVQAGTADMDAVNVKQLTDVVSPIKTTADQAAAEAEKHSSVTVAGSTEGTDVTSGNLLLTKTNPNRVGGNNYDLKLNDVITLGGNSTTPVTLDGTQGLITFNNGSNTTLQMNGQTGVITGLTNTTWDKETAVANRAASEGQLQSLNTLLDSTKTSGITIAGTSDTGSVLQLGKKAAFVGSAVQDGKTIADDYSDANVTTVTSSSDSNGNTTTHFYMKQDMVGRSLNLGQIGSDGKVADPAAQLYTQAASDTDSTLAGHLLLTGEARQGTGQSGYTSADFYVKDDVGSYLTDSNKPVTRVYYNDEAGIAYELANLKDGLHISGDNSTKADVELNKTLKLTGGATGTLTSGNIGVTATQTTSEDTDGYNAGLSIQLADTLTGLKKISFADSSVSIGKEGINAGGLKITNVQAGTEDTDAVNKKQLTDAQAAATTELVAGSNVTIDTPTTATDGHKVYTVNANFSGADVSGSNAVVYDGADKSTVTLRGTNGTKLTGLQDATPSDSSTEAVTGRQLYALQKVSQMPLAFQSDTGTSLSVNHGDTVHFKGDGNIHTTVLTENTASAKELKVSLDQDVYSSSFHVSTNSVSRNSANDSASLTSSPDLKRGVLTLQGKLPTEEGTLRTKGEFYVLGNDDAAAFLPAIYQSSNTEIIDPVRLGYKDQYDQVHQVATLEDGFLFTGDNSAKQLSQKLNSSVSIVGGAKNLSDDSLTDGNLAVVGKQNSYTDNGQTFEAGELRIKMAKDLKGLTSSEFTDAVGNKLTLQGDTVTLDRVNKNAGATAVSLTGRGLNNGNNKITGVKAGTEDTDAVNFGQISSIVNEDNTIKGFRVAGDSGNHEFHLGDQMTIQGGDEAGIQNLTTAMDSDGKLKVNLNRNVNLDKVEITSASNAGSRQVMARLGTHTDDFESGSQQQVGVLELMGQNHAGKIIETRIMATAGNPTLNDTNEYSTRLFYTNESTGAKRQVATLEDGLRFTGDNYTAASGDKAEQNVVKTQLDQTLHITGGQTDTQQLTDLTDKNIGVVAENGGLSIRLSKVLDGMTDIYMGDTRENSSHLTKNGLYLSSKTSTEYAVKFTADNGISAGNQIINYVKAGENDSDAATVGQLKDVAAKANNATKLTVNHNQPDGSLTLTDTLDKDGIHHTYDVALSNKVTVGSAGNSITLDGTANTINGGSYVKFGGNATSKTQTLAIGWQSAGLKDVLTDQDKGSQTGNYLTGLSNSSWDPVNVGYSPNRAATEGQLRDMEAQIWNNPITFLGNHDADKTAEESQGLTADLGATVRIIGTGTGEARDFDASNLNVIAGKTPDGTSDALIIQMKKAPNFTTVHAGTPDEQGVYPVSVGQVTVTRDGKTQTVDGVVITDGPMITKDGINNYGKQITHMKSGGIYNEEDKKYHYDSDEVGTNAATIQDVKNIANAAAQSEVEGKRVTVSGVNDNITVTTAADNPNHYQVKLSDTLKLGQDSKNNANIIIDGQKGKVTVGSGSTGNNSVIIDGNGGTVTIGNGTSGHQQVTIDGNDGTLSGLTNRTIDVSDFATKGRAATEEQLKQVADSVSNLDRTASKTDYQLVGEKDKDGNYTGDYKVSDDNKVKLHVQDSMHPDQVKDITIDNVAKASDLGDVSQISNDIQDKEHNTVVDSLNNLNEKVKDAANGSWESQIDGKAVKEIKAGGVQNFTSGDNIQLSDDNGAIKIAAKKDVSFDKVTIGSGDSQMTLDKDGLQTGKVKVSHSEINAGGNQIHGVADGTEKDDAATVGQVDTKVNAVNTKVDKVADAAGTAINTLGNHINRLDRRINKVGAGAAALAALHPDPNSDDDLSFAAGIGNYRGSTAAAIGAFYRPSDNVTVSMGATIGNGENMVNAGVTIGVGEGVGRNPSTRKAMAKEISQLKEANAAKDAEVRDLKKQVQTLQKQNEDTQEKLKRIMEKLGI